MGLTERIKAKIKEEGHYMKLGAKVLPKVAGQKVKGWAKGKWEEAKANARLQAEADREAKAAEKEAYKISLIEQARMRGQAKGRQRASRQGSGGFLAQLGEAGKRMSSSDLLGLGDMGTEAAGQPNFMMSGLGGKRKKGEVSSSDYLFSGLGQPQQQKRQVRVVHYVHHYPHRKKRRD